MVAHEARELEREVGIRELVEGAGVLECEERACEVAPVLALGRGPPGATCGKDDVRAERCASEAAVGDGLALLGGAVPEAREQVVALCLVGWGVAGVAALFGVGAVGGREAEAGVEDEGDVVALHSREVVEHRVHGAVGDAGVRFAVSQLRVVVVGAQHGDVAMAAVEPAGRRADGAAMSCIVEDESVSRLDSRVVDEMTQEAFLDVALRRLGVCKGANVVARDL